MPNTQIPPDVLTTFASSVSDGTRTQLLHHEPLLQDPNAVAALCDQANHWATKKPALAQKAAESALWLGKELGHKKSEALAHRTLANIFSYLARPSQALSEYEIAIALFSELGEHHQAAITRSSALPTLIETSGADVAFEWADNARGIFEAENDQLRLARLENNLALIFFRQEDFAKAQEHWKTAHAKLTSIGETSDLAATLRNLAVCSISLNRPNKARAYYHQARHLCTAHNFTFLLHTIDYNIAYLHYLEGDHHRALELYQQARARSQELDDKYHEALCSLDETDIYLELNLLQEAETVAQLAETQFRLQQRPYEAAKALFNLALVRSRRGHPQAALDHLEEAVEAFSGQRNILWPGQVELLRARIYFQEGRFFEAKRHASSALDRFAKSELPRPSAMARLLLARICHAMAALSEAQHLCSKALKSFEDLGEPDSLFQCHFVEGEICDSLGDTAGALLAFRKAESHLLELRERRGASKMRVSAIRQPLEVYPNLVGLLLNSEGTSAIPPEVFRLIEAAKARSFADLMALSGKHTHTQPTMRSQLVDQVSNLRQQLNWLHRRIDRSELQAKSTAPSVVAALQTQSQAKEQELARRLALLRTRTPSGTEDPERIGLSAVEDIQELLADSVLIEFFISHDIIIAMVISREERMVVPVAVMSTVRDLQRRLWYYLHHGSPHRARAGASTHFLAFRVLSQLHTELISPLEKLLGGSPLIFAPHGFLFLLPFHALWTGSEHLIDRTPVSYIPSAAALSRVVNGPAVQPGRLAVLGGPRGRKRVRVFPNGSSRWNEVQLSSLSSLLAQGGPRPAEPLSALHLVADVRLRDDNPLFSSVETGSESFTFLDLHRSKLLHPIVTIEAGDLAAGTQVGHSALSALWRAVLTSGARSALIPAGLGEESAEREHARLFYESLGQGAGAAVAYREATLAMKDQGAALHEWAGMSLVGDPLLRLSADS